MQIFAPIDSACKEKGVKRFFCTMLSRATETGP